MSNDEITKRLEASRSEIMGAIDGVSKDVKATARKVNDIEVNVARVEGKLDTHRVIIDRNTADIEANKKAVNGLRDSVRGMLVKASATGGVVGSVAGFLAGLLGG